MGRPTKWNERNIIESINVFVSKNNRLPTSREIDKYPDLPRRNTIKRVFGCDYKEFYTTYFKGYSISIQLSNEEILQQFKEQYIRLGCPSEYNYSINRDKSTPKAETICKYLGITYNELLQMCGFEIKRAGKVVQRTKRNYTVSISKHSEEVYISPLYYEIMDKLNNEIKKINKRLENK